MGRIFREYSDRIERVIADEIGKPVFDMPNPFISLIFLWMYEKNKGSNNGEC
jgi:hypothetical protein